MLRQLPQPEADELLVGANTGDDAAVWRLDDDRALVSTADFITPVVDDARAWGRIAAANAVSDVYAMGGSPLFALNLVGWNKDELPTDLLAEVLLGGSDVAAAGGFAIVGGHTIDDPEPKYGMAVTGIVHPDEIMTNAGLIAGQDLVLSKPLGIGIITTAIKGGVATEEIATAAVSSMETLNADAARVARSAGATGCTDVTGFGLLGHLGRMTVESGVHAEVEFDALPLIEGTLALAEAGMVPGGTRRNLDGNRHLLDAGSHGDIAQLVAADAQTSGGLVFGVDPTRTAGVLAELSGAAHIGRVVAGDPGITLH